MADPQVVGAVARVGSLRVQSALRSVLDRCRSGEVEPSDVIALVLASLPAAATEMLPVINATGVLVHTNLGRAPLSRAAQTAMVLASGTTNVEMDLVTGNRGRRGRSAISALLTAVPAAEDALVVNNGAAALALVAAAFGGTGHVVVARGELVEIGDGFRLPELLESTGANLREVGTTNRVHVGDYAGAIEGAAFILKVHPSNFVVSGFTSTVGVGELSALGVPVVVDIGSGLLRPHARLPDEPDAASALKAGAALVTASGDKLLGGPQCGLMLGAGDLIRQLRRHPLARAVRTDATTLAALEASVAGPPTPVALALDQTTDQLMKRAENIASHLPPSLGAVVVTSVAVVGGGGAPGVTLESVALAVPSELAMPLRTGRTPVVGHVHQGRLLLDLLTVGPEDDEGLVAAVTEAATQLGVLD